jgi:hypothetical protein
MRHVFPNREIPHLWMHQAQAEARNSDGTLYFNGPTIYSYGSHFPIASHVLNERGERAVLFTIARYSVTTSGHCSAVAAAIPANVPIFRVSHVRGSWGETPSHSDNAENYISRISELLDKVSRARSNREWLEREALSLREELRRYVAFFGFSGIAVPNSENLDALQGWISAHAEEEQGRKEEAARCAEQKRRREQRAQIKRFRSGDPTVNYIRGIPPMLRLRGNEVETSLGARFPIEHAVRGLELVRQVRQSGQEYIHNGHAIHLGHYRIDRIECNGTVHAGCHIVSWTEIESIAPQLEHGLIRP